MTLDKRYTPPVEPLPVRVAAALRGMWGVVWLFITALWELATALLGVRPSFLPAIRRFAHVIAEQYRTSADQYEWVDGEPVNDDRDVEP